MLVSKKKGCCWAIVCATCAGFTERLRVRISRQLPLRLTRRHLYDRPGILLVTFWAALNSLLKSFPSTHKKPSHATFYMDVHRWRAVSFMFASL